MSSQPRSPLDLEDALCEICGKDEAELLFEVDGYKLVRCRDCGLSYINPRPAAASRQYQSQTEYFDKTAFDPAGEKEQLESPLSWDRHRFRLLAAGLPPGRLLDVGCGTGRFMLQAMRGGWEVAGVEFNPHGAELARQTTRAEVFVGTVDASPFAAASFDAASMLHVLEHVHHPRGTLRRLHLLLRPRARLLVEVPDFGSPRAQRERERWTHCKPVEHFYYYELRTLRRLLKEEGFRILKVRRTGGLGLLGQKADPGKPAAWARPLYNARRWLGRTPRMRNLLRFLYWDMLRQHDHLLVVAERMT
ncbi:MAG: class I SAM-dependent methyltransferase [Acidobacteria bacterium]|nr:class I SAM-dependent methyltransferase [Acidobacteriota bacterium]